MLPLSENDLNIATTTYRHIDYGNNEERTSQPVREQHQQSPSEISASNTVTVPLESKKEGSISNRSSTTPIQSPCSQHPPPPSSSDQRHFTWIDIEKGPLDTTTYQSTPRQIQATCCLLDPSSCENPKCTTELSGPGTSVQSRPHTPSSLFNQPPTYQIHSTPNQTTSIQSPVTSITFPLTKLAEIKQSLSVYLYKSFPIRLLAYTILIFNALLIVKSTADPLSSFSIMNRINGYYASGQIPLDSALRLQQSIPCVAATSHNDEMQAAPFVSWLFFNLYVLHTLCFLSFIVGSFIKGFII